METDEFCEISARQNALKGQLNRIKNGIYENKKILTNKINNGISMFDKVKKEIDLYKNLDLEFIKYMDACINDDKNTIYLRTYFLSIIYGYLLCINYFFCYHLDYIQKNHLLFWSILGHNGLFLIVPIISFFRSYGDRNKNTYIPHDIKQELYLVQEKIKLKNDKIERYIRKEYEREQYKREQYEREKNKLDDKNN